MLEIAQLAGVNWAAKGVDAGQGEGDVKQIVNCCATSSMLWQ